MFLRFNSRKAPSWFALTECRLSGLGSNPSTRKHPKGISFVKVQNVLPPVFLIHVAERARKKNRNIHVDQLRSMVSAMGGNLIITANFEARKVELSHSGKAGDPHVKKARRHKTPTRKLRAFDPQSA
jgi:hypothetical protein